MQVEIIAHVLFHIMKVADNDYRIEQLATVQAGLDLCPCYVNRVQLKSNSMFIRTTNVHFLYT